MRVFEECLVFANRLKDLAGRIGGMQSDGLEIKPVIKCDIA
jgi:hypothetical protein